MPPEPEPEKHHEVAVAVATRSAVAQKLRSFLRPRLHARARLALAPLPGASPSTHASTTMRSEASTSTGSTCTRGSNKWPRARGRATRSTTSASSRGKWAAAPRAEPACASAVAPQRRAAAAAARRSGLALRSDSPASLSLATRPLATRLHRPDGGATTAAATTAAALKSSGTALVSAVRARVGGERARRACAAARAQPHVRSRTCERVRHIFGGVAAPRSRGFATRYCGRCLSSHAACAVRRPLGRPVARRCPVRECRYGGPTSLGQQATGALCSACEPSGRRCRVVCGVLLVLTAHSRSPRWWHVGAVWPACGRCLCRG